MVICSGDHLLWHAAMVRGRRDADLAVLAALVAPVQAAFAQLAVSAGCAAAAFAKSMRAVERAAAANRLPIRPKSVDRIAGEPASVPSREASVALRLSDPRTSGQGS